LDLLVVELVVDVLRGALPVGYVDDLRAIQEHLNLVRLKDG
jgi:hypothetical protein